MLAADEDALICDFAEVYHVYDWRSLPVSYAAVLAWGLRDDSRIKLAMSDSLVGLDTLLTASVVDLLALNLWSKSEDAAKGKNLPASIVDQLTGRRQARPASRDAVLTFASGADFARARAEILNKGV